MAMSAATNDQRRRVRAHSTGTERNASFSSDQVALLGHDGWGTHTFGIQRETISLQRCPNIPNQNNTREAELEILFRHKADPLSHLSSNSASEK